MAEYAERNLSILPQGALSGLTIGVYQHSTVGRDLMPKLLQSFGATVVALGHSDHFIPVDTEAVSEDTISLLTEWAQEHRLDAIISADGDADRPLVADETGTPLRGDLLGLITVQFLNASVAVTPVTSNSGIERNGSFSVIRTKVGSPFVIAGMEEALKEGSDGVTGFEANGGFLTGTAFSPSGATLAPLPTRDCILPILATLYSAAKNARPISHLAREYALPIADAERVTDYAQERSSALMAHLRESDANIDTFLASIGKVRAKSDIDGLRLFLEDGRTIHFRPSGNAPEMRCYVEAADETAARALLKQGLALIEDFDAQ